MNRRILILIGVYIAVILLFAYIRPEKMDWSPSFSPEKTIPFAARILYKELGSIRTEFLQLSVKPVYNTAGEFEEDRSAVYFFLNSSFDPGKLDMESLLEFVASGNTAFISSESISSDLLDTLGIRPEYEYVGSVNALEWFYEDNIVLTLAHHEEKEWHAAVSNGYWWYVLEDSTHTILGKVNDQHPNFVRCAFGDGQIFLHAFPYAFSNYHMLYKDNHGYVSNALAEVPTADAWLWDTYYLNATGGRAETPLAALNRYPSFRWAYWIGILGVCVFILFTAKRRQRLIPVLEPKRNTTLDFVHTIGDLYFHRADHADLMSKKISIMQAQMQKKYRLPVVDFSEEDAQEVAVRGGMALAHVEPLFAQIRKLRSQPASHTEALFTLQRHLDRFLRRL